MHHTLTTRMVYLITLLLVIISVLFALHQSGGI